MARPEEDFDRLDEAERKSLAAAVAPALLAFAKTTAEDFGLDFQPDFVESDIEGFVESYRERPCRENRGGCRFNSCVSIHVIARVLAPALVVESGTFHGQSAWVLRGARPAAEIRCYDPDLSNLVWRDRSVSFAERDWTEDEIAADGRPALLFFDDHVSQARRVVEAHERGFEALLFDDDIDTSRLGATGIPPAPTIRMVFDDELWDGRYLRWTRNGKDRSLMIDGASCDAARQLIAAAHHLPDLAAVNGWPSNERLSLVRLRR